MNKGEELIAGARAKWGRAKLDVGCGLYPRGEEFITVDRCAGEKVQTVTQVQEGGAVREAVVETEVKADLKADMWEIPLPDGEIDEIWCSHALEHAPMAKVIPTLKEFARLLKRGGRAVITVPNFDYIAKYWLLGQDRRWAEAMVMGLQTTAGEYHQSCFNADLLRGDLQGCGFEVKVVKLVWTHNQECLQAVAVKA